MTLKRALERSVRDNDKNQSKVESISALKKAYADKNKPQHLITGAMGENMAVDFLCALGYRIIDRNVSYKCGEIDIIAVDRDEIVFVEVRTRTVGRLMPAETTVGPHKLKKLVRTARIWTEGKHYGGFWRIDLIAITLNDGREPIIEHIGNITEGIK